MDGFSKYLLSAPHGLNIKIIKIHEFLLEKERGKFLTSTDKI